MPTRRQLIQKIELNSDASSVTFSDIPQNYTDLKLIYSIRNTNTNNYQTMNFNGSTSNFSQRELQGDGSSAGSGSRTDSLIRASVVPSNFTASTFSNTEIYIPNYTSSSYKSFSVKTIVENNSTTGYTWMISGLWSNTSTISSIGITSNMAAGSSIYLYGITHVPIIRGGEVEVRDGFKYHTFKSSGSLQVVEPGNVEYLVVSGGGGGGGGWGDYYGGGGGGAGGVLLQKIKLSSASNAVIVGAGGAGVQTSSGPGTSGVNSSLSSIGSAGGGGGGSWSDALTGGSGGGAGGRGNNLGASGISGQGNSGGNSIASNDGAYRNAGGGGGGAGEVGQQGGARGGYSGGNGGNGLIIWGYAVGGGGGGAGASTAQGASSGGLGGGAPGGPPSNLGSSGGGNASINAIANTGGGGGGSILGTGSSGGSGIVIIRYPYDGN